VRAGVRLLEEGLGQDLLPPRAGLGVHDRVEEGHEVRVQVLRDVDHLLPRWREWRGHGGWVHLLPGDGVGCFFQIRGWVRGRRRASGHSASQARGACNESVSRSSGASALTSPEGPRELAVRGEERATSLNAVLMKIPVIFCAEIERSILKYIWKYKIPRIAKAILSKLTNARGITIQNFKLYYRAITIKIIWYSHKNRKEDLWIRIYNPDINSYIYS
jgi:hypothetical protein